MSPRTSKIIFFGSLAIYLLIAGSRVVVFVQYAIPLEAFAATVVLCIPLLLFWLIWREISFGWAVKEMGRTFDAEGNDRVVHTGEPDPDDWRDWYRYGASYEAEGNRKKARAALRRALDLYRG